MPSENPMVKQLLDMLNLDHISGDVRILTNCNYENGLNVISVGIYTKNKQYAESLAKGIYNHASLIQKITAEVLPNPYASSTTMFPQNVIYKIELDMQSIKQLCNKLNICFEEIYNVCKPKINISARR
jgi:hypothetical protein